MFSYQINPVDVSWDCEAIIEVFDEVQERAGKLQPLRTQLVDLLEETEAAEAQLSDYCDGKSELIKKCYSRLNQIAETILDFTSEPPKGIRWVDEASNPAMFLYEIDQETIGLDMASDGRRLFLRLPLLLPRKSYDTRHHSQLYAGNISNAYLANQSDPNISQVKRNIEKKTVMYLFVVPPGFRALDNDNYDITAIHNAVTFGFPYGDEAEYCELIMKTVKTERIRKGTYITVFEQSDNFLGYPLNVEYLIDYWAERDKTEGNK